MTFLVAIRSLRVLLGPMARQLSIATESLRAQGREEDVMATTSSGVPYTSFDAEDDRSRSRS
jgi:hypothetical protein